MKIALYGFDQRLVSILRAKGVETVVLDKATAKPGDIPSDAEMLLTLGGDGTFLKALSLVRGRRVALAGINSGRLGFLTTAKLDENPEGWIGDIIEGRYEVEDRDLIKIQSDALPADFYPFAGNEFTIQRRGASMLAIDVKLDGRALPTYWSDGIVVATPTGSTAYSLSVGGPIVDPRSKVFVLAPIAPHNLNMRPLIIPAGSALDVEVASRDGEAVLTLDNRSIVIPSGTKISVRKGEYGFKYVSFSDNNFLKALETKLLWGQDKRNSQ